MKGNHIWMWNRQTITLISVALALALIVACGSAAPAPTSAPTAEATSPPAAQVTPTVAPVAEATPAPSPPEVTEPEGTLNIGYKELGSFMGHPKLTGNPQIGINSFLGLSETLVMHDTSGKFVPMLAKEWSVSSDFKVWTFELQQGVQFHGGYGEMTSEDVVWSYEQASESARHPRTQNIRNIWFNPAGSLDIVDPYTIRLDTGEPFSDVPIFEIMRTPAAGGVWIASKKQGQELGEEEVNARTALTGPWQLVEARSGELWKTEAVRDHWRKTPFFAEMVAWEIPEESSRIAGFQTGQLDTTVVAFDSIPALENVPGAKLMRIRAAGQAGLNFFGQSYVGAGTAEQRANYDSNLPWVSSNPDLNSAEWEQARKVRLALSIAIDRQGIVDTLLAGFGSPLVLRDWAGFEDRLPSDMKWDFDPERARQLLTEAGYPDGFEITLTPALRGAPSEVEACEAIASMWEDIGVRVKFQRIPYTTLRPTLVGWTYQGATCHSISNRIAPVQALSNYTNESVFNYGTTHPFLEELVPRGLGEPDPQERMKVELEMARFFYDHVLAATGLYTFDVVFPIGPRIDDWSEHVRRGDLRDIQTTEWIPHRK